MRRWIARLAGWLILFGVSDIIEVSTGAFWRPWWLLALKGTCLIGMATCAMMLWRIRTAADR